MFLRPHLVKLSDDGTVKTLIKPSVLAQKIVIVPREFCGFRQVEALGEGSQAIKALRLRLERESLTAGQTFHIEKPTGKNTVSVWSFPERFARAGRCLPESLAYVPMDTGRRLIAGLNGYDGQVWKDGRLIATRWWGRVPSDQDWDLFAKSSLNGGESLKKPDIVQPRFRTDLPIISLTAEDLSRQFSPTRLATGLAVISLAALVFLLVQDIRYGARIAMLEGDVDVIEQEAQEVLAERRRALRNIEFPRRLEALGDTATLATALYAVTTVLSGEDLVFSSVNSRGNELTVSFVGTTERSGPQLVTDLQALPIFSAVNVNFGVNNTLDVEAELMPFQSAATVEAVTEGVE